MLWSRPGPSFSAEVVVVVEVWRGVKKEEDDVISHYKYQNYLILRIIHGYCKRQCRVKQRRNCSIPRDKSFKTVAFCKGNETFLDYICTFITLAHILCRAR